MEEKNLIFASKLRFPFSSYTCWYHPMTSNGDLESTLCKENSNKYYVDLHAIYT